MAALKGARANGSARPILPRDVQDWLVAFYDLPDQHPVDAFLCDEAQAAVLLGAPPNRDELLLVDPEPDGEGAAGVSLYLSPALLERVEDAAAGRMAPSIGDFLTVVEGVSHFAYVAYRAPRGEPVTELELELQAEVDKYAVAVLGAGEPLLKGHGVGVIRASQRWRAALFEGVRFLDAERSERGRRYRRAHRLAARLCGDLEAREARRGGPRAVRERLRRFYRLRQGDKLAAARS